MSFVEELRWRGMLQDIVPGTEELLQKEKVKGYIGFDPTAPSLHVGSLATIMLLVHFQRYGHHPIAVVGGATGMVGDPSGKSEERNLLTPEIIGENVAGVRKELGRFLDFDSKTNPAIIVNNYDWFKEMNVLEFLRDVGKHITVNYMMSKDSVKSRMETGISYTEFAYQLLQGYDFYWLHQNHDCKMQMGGSDQWGNMTTGTELIRRKAGGEAVALTTPLVTKSDGGKFGKTESGTIWLSAERTSPYKFYQFWINQSDDDAERYIKVFSLMTKEEIEGIIADHKAAPHTRALQKALAKEVTTRVHSDELYEHAVKTSEILFGKATKETLLSLSEKDLLDVFEGVPQFEVSKEMLSNKISAIDFLGETSGVLPSKSEARRALKENSISINTQKANGVDAQISTDDLLNGRYMLVQRGKKKYFLVKAI